MGWNDLVLVTADLLGIEAEARFLGNHHFDRYKEKGARNGEFAQKWRIYRWIRHDRVLVEATRCAGSAYQMPTSKRPSNAQDAASGKSLAKCEKSLCLRHFGEHWLILRALSLTTNGHLFPVV